MKNYFIIILSILVISLSGYLLYDSINNQPSQEEIQQEFNQLKADYEAIEKDLEEELKANEIIDNKLISYKNQLEQIINKPNISADELNEAKKIMSNISKITYSRYKSKIKKLIAENNAVSTDIQETTLEKDIISNELNKTNKKIIILENDNRKLDQALNLEKKQSQQKDIIIERAAQLNLSNFILKAYKIRDNGKEVETDKASRIDRIKISFEVIENFLVKPGLKTFYILFTNPDGKIVTFTNKNAGTFRLKNGKTLNYSDMVSFNYTSGQTGIIELTWDNEDFKRGDYLIEVYHNDTKIGKATKSLQ